VFFIMVGRHRAERELTRAGNADGMLNLIGCELQHPAGDDGRDERGQRRMMPAALADAGECGFTQPHLELMTEHDADDQLATIAAHQLGTCQRRGNDVRWMRRVLLPVDVVVIHHADHQRIGQRGRHRVAASRHSQHRARAGARDLVQDVERNLRVFLPVPAESAAERVEQEAFRFVNDVVRQIFIAQPGRPQSQ
jgi:hypothetical protein